MAEEVYKEEAKTVEELQAEIAALKQELADMKAQSQPADDAAASVVKAMEESTEDKDVKKARLLLSYGVKTVLAQGLDLLGIQAPEKM